MNGFERPDGLPKIGDVLRVWHVRDGAETWEEAQVVQICGEDDGSFVVWCQFVHTKVPLIFTGEGCWGIGDYPFERLEIAY